MKKRVTGLIVFLTFLAPGLLVLAKENQQTTEHLIKIETTQGTMILKLCNETPIHRDNMLKLIRDGFFDGQLFHRVISGFMIQGGDPHSVLADKGQRLGSGGPGYTLEAEFRPQLVHQKGALAAARQGDQLNPEKRSSGSQFYIVQGRVYSHEELDVLSRRGMGNFTPEAVRTYTTTGGAPHLDGSYTVFGQLVEGMDVLDRIASLPTDAYDRPLDDVVYTISVIR